MTTYKLLAALFAAGGCGALSRYALSSYLAEFFGKGTPWGTAIVNILGCFCFGGIAALFAVRTNWDPQYKTVVLTGFFGAFTTFSTYAFELNALLRAGEFSRAFCDFALQNAGGLAAAALGAAIVAKSVVN